MRKESTNSIVLVWMAAAAGRLATIRKKINEAAELIHANNLDDAFLATAKGMRYLSIDWRGGSV